MPARGLLGHGLEPGGRAPAPGGGGRAPAGPWEAGARGQGPQVLLRRSEDPPAGVGGQRRGSRGKYLKESMPLLPGLLEGAGELDGEPRHEPGRQGRAGWP